MSAGLALALLLAAGRQGGPRAADAPAPRAPFDVVARLSSSLERVRGEWGFPGATAGVVLPDGRLAEVVVGFADEDRVRAVLPGSRMLAGSIGKTFVSAVALQLVDEGKLDLDQRLARWLGDEPWLARLPNGAEVTLRQLLLHRSGVPEHVLLPAFWEAIDAAPDRVWEPEELVAFVLDADPLFPPGERFSYADTNYVLAAMAVERAAGGELFELVRERVLAPLDLSGIVPAQGREIPHLVPGHLAVPNPFGWPRTNVQGGRFLVDPQSEWAGGGFASTGADLARWAFALYGGRFLSPERTAELLDARETESARSPGRYGLGVQVWESPLGAVQGHEGWYPGYRSIMGYFPEHGIAAAVQLNADDEGRVRDLRPLLVDLARTALEESER